MSAADNAALGRLFFAEQDRLRGVPARELCADTYTAELNAYPIMDYEGHRAFTGSFYAAFPDARHVIEDTVAADESVAVRFRLRGTHGADFMGLASTGRQIDVVATTILHVCDGRVTSLRAVFDQASMLEQLTA